MCWVRRTGPPPCARGRTPCGTRLRSAKMCRPETSRRTRRRSSRSPARTVGSTTSRWCTRARARANGSRRRDGRYGPGQRAGALLVRGGQERSADHAQDDGQARHAVEWRRARRATARAASGDCFIVTKTVLPLSYTSRTFSNVPVRSAGRAAGRWRTMRPVRARPRPIPPRDSRAGDAEAARAVCRHFAGGACLFGDACAFSHDIEPGTRRRPAGEDARPLFRRRAPDATPRSGVRRAPAERREQGEVLGVPPLGARDLRPRVPVFGRGRAGRRGRQRRTRVRAPQRLRRPGDGGGPAPHAPGRVRAQVQGGVLPPEPRAGGRRLRPQAPKTRRSPRPSTAASSFPRRLARARRGRAALRGARVAARAARETRWSRRGLVASADENADDGGDEHTSDAVTNTPSHDATEPPESESVPILKSTKESRERLRMERPVRARRALRQRELFESRKASIELDGALSLPKTRSKANDDTNDSLRLRRDATTRRDRTSGIQIRKKIRSRLARSGTSPLETPPPPSRSRWTRTRRSRVWSARSPNARWCLVCTPTKQRTRSWTSRWNAGSLRGCAVLRVLAGVPPRRRPASPKPAAGGAVTTHAHLVQYLLAKAPGACRTATLPFGGMNTVVYSLGGAPGRHETCAEIVPD